MNYKSALSGMMEAGKELAAGGDAAEWDAVDAKIVPGISRLIRNAGTDDASRALVAGYLTSEDGDIQDYGATLAAAIFEEELYRPSLHWDIFDGLERLAYGTASVFPRFRASKALVETGQLIVADSGYDFGTLKSNLEAGAETDPDLKASAAVLKQRLRGMENRFRPS